jgi:hypothetical protein
VQKARHAVIWFFRIRGVGKHVSKVLVQQIRISSVNLIENEIKKSLIGSSSEAMMIITILCRVMMDIREKSRVLQLSTSVFRLKKIKNNSPCVLDFRRSTRTSAVPV